MSMVKLKEYGLNLSGRPLGIKTYSIIINDYEAPYELDFNGVFSIGSSFADEVVARLAEINNGKIRILNSSRVIDKCLKNVSKDKGFELVY
ncbi:MAG: DUF4325 domain-containing protein [Bacteriovoracaceae bacterium]|nr:DUF4325 domain-containing protein [Bacteriovoracaceae bacterium]